MLTAILAFAMAPKAHGCIAKGFDDPRVGSEIAKKSKRIGGAIFQGKVLKTEVALSGNTATTTYQVSKAIWGVVPGQRVRVTHYTRQSFCTFPPNMTVGASVSVHAKRDWIFGPLNETHGPVYLPVSRFFYLFLVLIGALIFYGLYRKRIYNSGVQQVNSK